MAKTVKLLLVENVDSLGIVGDVVNVRTGYARNFLLPRELATQPSEERIKELAGKRAEAQKQIEQMRQQRLGMSEKLKGVEITLVRSCNDQGILYGAITQQELATALREQGFHIQPRDVRITQAIKRIDNYDIHIKLDSDLDSLIKVHVKADRELATDVKPTNAEGEPEAAGAAGAGAEEGGRKRRDQWALPDDSNRVVGWGSAKKDEAKAEGKSEGKGEGKRSSKKSDGDEGKGEKKSKKKAE